MVQINQQYPKMESDKFDITKLVDILSDGSNEEDKKKLQQVLELISTKIDKNKLYQSLDIASILYDLKMDPKSVLTGLLILAIRENCINIDIISEKIDKDVSKLIIGVVKMDAIAGIQEKMDIHINQFNTDAKADAIRKMLIAMVKDPRVVVIRLAEHLSELKSLSKSSIEEQQKVARETRLIYAPLANRLGIGQIKWQLEDFAFRYLEQSTYKEIAGLLSEKRIDRDKYIKDFISNLKTKLTEENIKAEVTGRVKHIFSIWRKMKRKNLEFDEVYDIRAVRILTNSVRDCYAALGMVHSLWRHIPKEFDDYIAMPKDNGYQSLHTAVIGPNGKIVEVQIRTYEMDNDSELGVAAHWRYKEGVSHDRSFESKIAWLRQLIEWQDELSSASDVLDELKADIIEDRVYVLTPKGDVFDLPEGATPLDLAYHIHTEVGNKCCGAKVSGKMVPLTYSLKTGDHVELLTRNNIQPSRDWLNPHFNFIKTARARSKVQSWFRKQDFSRNVIDGREILDRELQRLGVGHIDLYSLNEKLNVKTEDDILAGLARGDIKLNHVLNAANIKPVIHHPEDKDTAVLTSPSKTNQQQKAKGINISGVDNLLTKLAGCCKPIPGNAIVGYVSQGRGITVHCTDCINIEIIRDKHPERLVDVTWGERANNMSFTSDIFIQSRDGKDFLRDITGLLSADKININKLKTDTDKYGVVSTYISVEIHNVEMLNKLLSKIKLLPSVIKAEKLKGS